MDTLIGSSRWLGKVKRANPLKYLIHVQTVHFHRDNYQLTENGQGPTAQMEQLLSNE